MTEPYGVAPINDNMRTCLTLASDLAISSPSPRPAPVTRATFPSNENSDIATMFAFQSHSRQIILSHRQLDKRISTTETASDIAAQCHYRSNRLDSSGKSAKSLSIKSIKADVKINKTSDKQAKLLKLNGRIKRSVG